jgi:hypothetical protein
MDVMDDPKAIKKALIRKHNKRNFIIQKMIDAKQQENERAEEDERIVQESFDKNYAVPSTIDGDAQGKATHYRNMITGKKRTSRERWNRFAGTSDGGGRGL